MDNPREYIENKIQKRKAKEYIRNYILIAFIVVVFLSGIFLGKLITVKEIKDKINEKIANNTTEEVEGFNTSKINAIINILKNKFYNPDNIDSKKMFDGALYGMVDSLGDDYTTYFNEEDVKSFSEQMTGTFCGIGAEIGIKNNTLTVISPLPGTPAEKAGLKTGDKILMINGEDTNGMSTNVAASKIRGEKGTEVTLSVLKTDNTTKEIVIVRDEIIVESVKYEKKDGVAIIKISDFNDNVSQKLNSVVQEVSNDSSIKGIVLDLRGNPGGYLTTAIEVSSYWLPKNAVVVSEKDKNNSVSYHRSYGFNVLSKYKTVVLIDEGSASASEIVAGALHDNEKATLVGKTSFGKGSVQEYQEFIDGTAIKVTVAEWFTPNGNNINKDGIKPDIEVDYTVEDYNNENDTQLNKAIELILNK